MTTHPTHSDHDHRHAPSCGHVAVEHDGHVDYLHDGHAHHLHGDHYDEHALTAHVVAEVHDHTHGDGCGHEAVVHDDHIDYLHGAHRHALHDDHELLTVLLMYAVGTGVVRLCSCVSVCVALLDVSVFVDGAVFVL